MSLPSLYRRRKRNRDGSGEDIFQYKVILPQVRIQILLAIDNQLEGVENYDLSKNNIYGEIVKILREEIGTYNLVGGYVENNAKEFHSWLIGVDDIGLILDALEVWYAIGGLYARRRSEGEGFERAVNKINARLLEAGIGYSFIGNQIVEKSDEFLHQETVVPALSVLCSARFKNANEEFRSAHAAYRAGEYEDCLTDCLKAFESVMKVIASERRWTKVDDNSTASQLVNALFENDYVPSYMQSQFNGLKTLLTSSVPTTRNKDGGHGRGTKQHSVPQSLAALQIHQTAAIIVFLAALDGQ